MSGGIQATLRPYQERVAELEEALRTRDAEIAELKKALHAIASCDGGVSGDIAIEVLMSGSTSS